MSCHTIGGGRTVGPDLKGISAKRERDWLVVFIVSPERMVTQGDPLAKQLVQEYGMTMPAMGLTEDEAEDVLEYIDLQSGSTVSTPPPPSSTPPATGDADRGMEIFLGRVALRNGGPSCLSCHNIAGSGTIGGNMAKDLTASSGLPESAVVSLLKTPSFPVMKEIYAGKPLTDSEIADLAAFLKKTGQTAGAEPSSSSPAVFFLVGGAGFLVVIVLFAFIWRGRLTGVRQPLVRGGSK